MAFPKLLQKLFQNNGGGSQLNPEIIPTDMALSDTSTYPIANKVVKAAIDAKTSDVDSALSTTSINPVQNKVLTAKFNSLATVATSGSYDDLTDKPTIVSANTDTLFSRPSLYTCAKRSITIPKNLSVAINGTIYKTTSTVTISLTSPTAGSDYYIYACVPSSGTVPIILISANSTVPDGYTSANSRKIGGFHTLCVAVGTPTYMDSLAKTNKSHWLSGYVAGDIVPASCWDLYHRPKCDSPEAMVYGGSVGLDVWIDIYLSSWDGSKLVSKYSQATADGSSSKPFHGELFNEAYQAIGKRLPRRDEFVMMARGSNEATNIYGSSDQTTTGGHKDTASIRMISNLGMEDCCGFLWQWTGDLGFAGGSSWTESVYNSSIDGRSYGKTYGTLYRLLAGSNWDDGSACGSRSCFCNPASASVRADSGSRGASEPLHVNAINALRIAD